jgi:LDH2 family malate/lactate/ureidoglycolate dehydrogenase
VPIGVARSALEAAFVDAGCAPTEAARITDALIDAELCAVPTHGLLRVPWYLQAMRSGAVATGLEPTVERRTPAIARVDGHGAYGFLPTWVAVQEAVSGARSTGVGAAAVRNVGEFGRAAYYAAEASRLGCVAIVCQNTLPLVAAPGSSTATHGNNPLAFSAPAADSPTFDAAFTPRSGGELRRRAVLDLPLPIDWGYVDGDGTPTTDPKAASATAQQAIGGAKGFGIAVLVDLLAGVLAGAASGIDVPAGQPVVGAFVMAFDPAAFGVARGVLERQLTATATVVRGSGGRWPGDRAAAARRAARRAGAFAVPRPIFELADEAAGGRLSAPSRR